MFGLCELTFSWREINHPLQVYTMDNTPPQTLVDLDTLAEALWSKVQTYWVTGKGVQSNLGLAVSEAIRKVTAAGQTQI